MTKKVAINWPCFTKEEADKVSSVLLSNKVNYWTGQEGREFEKEFASYVGVKYAIAVANGTVAIDLALMALGIGANNGGSIKDEVIVTPRTFLASVSTVVNAGATPVFADVDLNSQNIEANTIKNVLTSNTKAVIVVHLAGMPAEMDAIMGLSEKYNFFVIEDCAQAHGARYKGQSVGSIGHIGAWSFCQDKIMTTGGEGGMVTTNDKLFWEKMWSYKDHGKSFDAVYNHDHPPGFRWLHERFGTNWRMTEMQSCIGRIQLTKMDDWNKMRLENGAQLDQAAGHFECIRLVKVPDYINHAEYKHYMFIKPEKLAEGWSRDRIVDEISKRGVPCFQGSCSEVYLEKAFDNTSWRPQKRLLNAAELGETSLMFLVHPTLTQTEIDKTIEVMNLIFAEASAI
ncbi:L-glutamine:2-deoxy-scyllo-inosose aminotransferase [Marinomonas spartinae]|uniref:DegT/DnrJ/EryC1/StrS family aminotransferase n=1 Tax=Marinomonas spartinae TaxID=1792290 RepID=UPI000808FB2D|nr:DegT/DnrJ/EryC1/StrS aminotransferase family protein [Marinomonas spartinae]SBS40445.1 L-glutamine:2-deoxy-scyllo-inosose aminotransferase [Marinomonas spartinae]